MRVPEFPFCFVFGRVCMCARVCVSYVCVVVCVCVCVCGVCVPVRSSSDDGLDPFSLTSRYG